MTEFRMERDILGAIEVPVDKYWGAQTARALVHFPIGTETFPPAFIRALAIIKKASALTNRDFKILSQDKCDWITQAAGEVISGQWDAQFPLMIWQSGSGTQTNMNINEVIANRAIEIAGGQLGSKDPVHPNDDVNMSQSSNDVIPSAIHIACAEMIKYQLLPNLLLLQDSLIDKKNEFEEVIKVGRTHLMDAVPITLGHEFDMYAEQIDNGIQVIDANLPPIYTLPIGGTAVGTGLNTPGKDYAQKVVDYISETCDIPFATQANKSVGIAAHDAVVALSGALKTLAVILLKIANDLRWMSSGPRCGLGEITLPANEPGSSIMPGKINPTQCEALSMVCAQVLGNDTVINLAGAGGSFELNTYKPVMAYNILQSIRLLSDAIESFTLYCVNGIEVNQDKINQYLSNTLMLITALNPHIGYDKAAEIAHKAYQEKISLKAATLQLGYLDEETFDQLVDPQKMLGPGD